MSRKFSILFSLTLAFGSVGGVEAQSADLVFKKVKKGKALSLRGCKLIKGFKRASITNNGGSVELEGKKPLNLGAKYKYFGCENNGVSKFDTLYSKSTEDGAISAFTFKASDFKNKPNPLKKYCKSISGVTYLLKPASPGHIHDSREPGFALICAPGKKCPRFPAQIRYSDGEEAASLCYYGRWSGNGQSRAYCAVGSCRACDARAIARESSTKKRDGRIYIEYGDGTCAQADADGRNGSAF